VDYDVATEAGDMEVKEGGGGGGKGSKSQNVRQERRASLEMGQMWAQNKTRRGGGAKKGNVRRGGGGKGGMLKFTRDRVARVKFSQNESVGG